MESVRLSANLSVSWLGKWRCCWTLQNLKIQMLSKMLVRWVWILNRQTQFISRQQNQVKLLTIGFGYLFWRIPNDLIILIYPNHSPPIRGIGHVLYQPHQPRAWDLRSMMLQRNSKTNSRGSKTTSRPPQLRCSGWIWMDLSLDWFCWGNLNRKPMGFYHQIVGAFRLNFSHHPILWICILDMHLTPRNLPKSIYLSIVHHLCEKYGAQNWLFKIAMENHHF